MVATFVGSIQWVFALAYFWATQALNSTQTDCESASHLPHGMHGFRVLSGLVVVCNLVMGLSFSKFRSR